MDFNAIQAAYDPDVFHELRNDRVFEARTLVAEYRFRLKSIGTVPVTVRVYLNIEREDTEPYIYRVSHYVQTPEAVGAYQTATAWAPSPAAALRQAILGLTHPIDTAMALGYTPHESWMIAAGPTALL